jgi:hypothetical protein
MVNFSPGRFSPAEKFLVKTEWEFGWAPEIIQMF